MALAPSRALILTPIARLYIAPGNPLSRPLSQSKTLFCRVHPWTLQSSYAAQFKFFSLTLALLCSRLSGISSGLTWHSFLSFMPVPLLFLYSFCFPSFLSFAFFNVSLLFPLLYFLLHSRFSLPFHSLLGRTLTRSLLSRNPHTLRFSLRFFATQDLSSLIWNLLLALTIIINITIAIINIIIIILIIIIIIIICNDSNCSDQQKSLN